MGALEQVDVVLHLADLDLAKDEVLALVVVRHP
jgi:hypothetical protein